MDESVTWQFDEYLENVFLLKEVDINSYSPLALAYIGDSIYDLIIKKNMVYIREDAMPRVFRRQRISRSRITVVQRDLRR